MGIIFSLLHYIFKIRSRIKTCQRQLGFYQSPQSKPILSISFTEQQHQAPSIQYTSTSTVQEATRRGKKNHKIAAQCINITSEVLLVLLVVLVLVPLTTSTVARRTPAGTTHAQYFLRSELIGAGFLLASIKQPRTVKQRFLKFKGSNIYSNMYYYSLLEIYYRLHDTLLHIYIQI